MNGRIHILPDTVVDKIAAGEVVERPASVVKELVEKSLDAGARSIIVTARTGGRDLIEVVDDACGMNADDARLALRRHATSKIAAVEDLAGLGSYGFRGEALPSIAAVSRLVLETSASPGGEGVRIVAEGGEVKTCEPCARRQGTTVRVEHLFANVPARRKFLKSIQTEYRHILRTVTEAALVSLDTALTFIHDERTVFELTAREDLRRRSAALFGRQSVSGAVLLAAELDDLRLSGLLGSPRAARRTASAVYVFVNGRPVAHRGLAWALTAGYGELLGGERSPFACLFVQVPPDTLDVNVHPAKREVRFTNEARVKEVVQVAVREALGRELGTAAFARGGRPGAARSADGAGEGAAGLGRRIEGSDLPWRTGGLFTGLVREAREAAASLFATPPGEEEPGTPPELLPAAAPTVGTAAGAAAQPPEDPMIWQLHERYLLAPIRGGMLIVDQHAAHERILYEEVLRNLGGQPAVSQQLLFPHVFDLTAEQCSLVEEYGPLLDRIGFTLRPFGGNTVVMEAVPPALERAGAAEEIVLGLLDDLAAGGGGTVQERIAAGMACRAAVKFGRRLDPDERRALVDRLFACARPQVCPHGRPTHLVLTLDEFDRRFERG